jgi:hypothetical protein
MLFWQYAAQQIAASTTERKAFLQIIGSLGYLVIGSFGFQCQVTQ